MESFAYGVCVLIVFHVMLGFMLGIYMVPTIIAVFRDHHRGPWIGLLNFSAGWTVGGWIAALAWSMTATRRPTAIIPTGTTALVTTPVTMPSGAA